MIKLQEMFVFLTVFPNALVYLLVITFSTAVAFIIAIKAHRKAQNKSTRRTVIGLAIILSLQFLLFIVSSLSWGKNSIFANTLPVLDRTVTLLALIWIIWLLLFQQTKLWADILASLLSGITLIAAALTFLIWRNQSTMGIFNGSWIDAVWQTAAILLSFAGLMYLLFKSTHARAEGLLILIFSSTGHLLQLVIPNSGILPAAVRLSQLFIYPLLISSVWSIANPPDQYSAQSKFKNTKEQKETVSRRIDITPKLITSLLEISLQNTSINLNNAISHTVSLVMMADICAVLKLDEHQKTIYFESAYDLIREEYLKNFSVTSQQAPNLYQSFAAGNILEMKGSDPSNIDLQNIETLTGYNQLGDLTFFPLKYNRKQAAFGLLLLTPYTFRTWDADSFEKLESFSPTLAKILENASEIDTRNTAAEAIMISLNQTSRENQKLHEQLERAQTLLAEFRQQFNSTISNHQQEKQVWLETQNTLQADVQRLEHHGNKYKDASEKVRVLNKQKQDLENKLQAEVQRLEHQDNKYKDTLEKVRVLNKQKQDMEKKLQQSKKVSDNLKQALLKAKTFIDESIAAQALNSKDDITITKPATDNLHQDSKTEVIIQQQQVPVSTFMLQPLIKNIKETLSKAYTRKNVSLSIDQINLPTRIKAQYEQIKKVIYGLLTNALEASPSGEYVHMEVRIDQTQQVPALLSIQVTDHGGGLSIQEQNTFFSMLKRIGQPIPDGIGDAETLYDVIKLVQEFQGNIWIKSDIEHPSTYKVVLPVMIVKDK